MKTAGRGQWPARALRPDIAHQTPTWLASACGGPATLPRAAWGSRPTYSVMIGVTGFWDGLDAGGLASNGSRSGWASLRLAAGAGPQAAKVQARPRISVARRVARMVDLR